VVTVTHPALPACYISLACQSHIHKMTAPLDCSSNQEEQAVVLKDLTFSYPGCSPFLKSISLDLPRGSRALLIGANGAGKSCDCVCINPAVSASCQQLSVWWPGCLNVNKQPERCVSEQFFQGNNKILCYDVVMDAGKTTLLQLIAGKYMVGRETIRVLGQSPFYAMVSV
jgi:energy-coupling factor transporter ATP-binding protein EcfA2